MIETCKQGNILVLEQFLREGHILVTCKQGNILVPTADGDIFIVCGFSLACCQTSFLCEVAAFKCPIYPILKTLPGEMVCLAVDFLRDMVCIPGFLDSHQGPRIIPHSPYIRYNRNKLIPS